MFDQNGRCILGGGREEGGSKETFWLRRKAGDDTSIQLKASNGKWVRVDVGGTLYADVM